MSRALRWLCFIALAAPVIALGLILSAPAADTATSSDTVVLRLDTADAQRVADQVARRPPPNVTVRLGRQGLVVEGSTAAVKNAVVMITGIDPIRNTRWVRVDSNRDLPSHEQILHSTDSELRQVVADLTTHVLLLEARLMQLEGSR